MISSYFFSSCAITNFIITLIFSSVRIGDLRIDGSWLDQSDQALLSILILLALLLGIFHFVAIKGKQNKGARKIWSKKHLKRIWNQRIIVFQSTIWCFSIPVIYLFHFRWVLFPNEIPRSVVKGKEYFRPGEDDEAIMYFDKVLPQMKQKEGEHLKIIELTQGPGNSICNKLWFSNLLLQILSVYICF